MSSTNLNQKKETKIVSGAGDGVRPSILSAKSTPKTKRKIQTASCRKFNTPRYQKPQNTTENVLKNAIETLEKKSRPCMTPKRKSLTLAEITPSKSKFGKEFDCKNAYSSAPSTSRGQGKTKDEQDPKERNAGRKVYQTLLLNAFRKRGEEFSALTEKYEALRQRIGKFEIQVEVLQKLRESEGRRRSEARSENVSLSIKLEMYEEEKKKLEKDNEMLSKEIIELKDKLEKAKGQYESIKDDLSRACEEIKCYEVQLKTERKSAVNLKEEMKNIYSQVIYNYFKFYSFFYF